MKRIFCIIFVFIIVMLTCTACSPSASSFETEFQNYMKDNFIADYVLEGTSCSHITSTSTIHRDDVMYFHCSVEIPVHLNFTITCKVISDGIFKKSIKVSDNYKSALSNWLTEQYGVKDITDWNEEDVIDYIVEHLEEGSNIYASVISTNKEVVPAIEFEFIRSEKIYKYTAAWTHRNAIREDLDELIFGPKYAIV